MKPVQVLKATIFLMTWDAFKNIIRYRVLQEEISIFDALNILSLKKEGRV